MFFVIFMVLVVHNVGGFQIGERKYENNPFLTGLIKPHEKPAPAVTSPTIPEPMEVPDDFTINGVKPQFDALPEMNGNSMSDETPQIILENNNGELFKWCLAPRGQFPSGYCNKFVNCWEGNVVEQFCPQTLMFNPKGYCDYALNVDCQGKPVQFQPQVVEGPSAGTWPSDGSYVPSPPINNNPPSPTPSPVATPSPPPRVPEVATSSTQSPSSTSTSVVSSPPIVIDEDLKKLCLQPRGQFPGRRCGTFVNCWDDVVLEQECPGGLNFNKDKGYCDFPYNSPCRDGHTSQEPINDEVNNALPELSKSDCPEPYGTFKNVSNCAGYFTCVDNKVAIQFECPVGYLFNSLIGVCDLEFRVDCKLNNNNHNSLPPAIVNPSFRCVEGTVYRLNENCSRVALCRNTLTEIVQCPGRLTYDVRSDTCSEPHLARC